MSKRVVSDKNIAIETREDLRRQLRRVRQYEEEQRALVASLTRQFQEAEKEDDRALTKFIRDQNDETRAARDETHARREQLLQEQRRAETHFEAAAVARKAVQDELAALYAEHFDDFAAEAEQATEQAHAALLALAEPYTAAMQAWSAAVAKWGPLAPAIRERLIAHEQESGVFPDVSYRQGASQVAPFPLPNATSIFGAVNAGNLAARPRALEPAELPADAIEETITVGE